MSWGKLSLNEVFSQLFSNQHVFFLCHSKYLEKDMYAYTSLPVEEAAEAECPMMFVSFPSAKDPNWEQKYPGRYSYYKPEDQWCCKRSPEIGDMRPQLTLP